MANEPEDTPPAANTDSDDVTPAEDAPTTAPFATNQRSKRRLVIWAAVAATVIAVIAAFLAFRPDKLFVDETVDEKLSDDVSAALTTVPTTTPTSASSGQSGPITTPTTANPNAPVVLARGNWTSIEHDTSGTVAIVRRGGKAQLILQSLKTENGPDLKVYLSTHPATAAHDADYESDAINLGELKGNVGTQTYDIPASVDVASLRSVAIWCQRFTVGFGAADLV